MKRNLHPLGVLFLNVIVADGFGSDKISIGKILYGHTSSVHPSGAAAATACLGNSGTSNCHRFPAQTSLPLYRFGL